jgi:NhaP-type Na+/H+ and K+/H+ antiporters with a unique C-terminal domain
MSKAGLDHHRGDRDHRRLITAAITGIAAHYILGVPMIVALLLGATLASTDPATLVPIFRQVHIRDAWRRR